MSIFDIFRGRGNPDASMQKKRETWEESERRKMREYGDQMRMQALQLERLLDSYLLMDKKQLTTATGKTPDQLYKELYSKQLEIGHRAFQTEAFGDKLHKFLREYTTPTYIRPESDIPPEEGAEHEPPSFTDGLLSLYELEADPVQYRNAVQALKTEGYKPLAKSESEELFDYGLRGDGSIWSDHPGAPQPIDVIKRLRDEKKMNAVAVYRKVGNDGDWAWFVYKK